MEQPQYIVQMNNIYKSFNGVKALKDVSINLQKNEVSVTMAPENPP